MHLYRWCEDAYLQCLFRWIKRRCSKASSVLLYNCSRELGAKLDSDYIVTACDVKWLMAMYWTLCDGLMWYVAWGRKVRPLPYTPAVSECSNSKIWYNLGFNHRQLLPYMVSTVPELSIDTFSGSPRFSNETTAAEKGVGDRNTGAYQVNTTYNVFWICFHSTRWLDMRQNGIDQNFLPLDAGKRPHTEMIFASYYDAPRSLYFSVSSRLHSVAQSHKP